MEEGGPSKTVGCVKPAMERWLAESPKEEPFRAVVGNYQQSLGLVQTGQADRGHQNSEDKAITPNTSQ